MVQSVILNKKSEIKEALSRIEKILEELPEGMYEVRVDKPTRTDKQNNALHLFFSNVANSLNEAGHFFSPDFFRDGFECEWNGTMVKELIWKPLQRALFDIESTKKLNTLQLTKVVEYFYLLLAKKGIDEQFPSREYLISELSK